MKKFDKLCVVLDPGHASSTAGKRSPILEDGSRFFEWAFNRELGDLLAELLRSYGIEVFFTTDATRDGDKDVSLTERANRANKFIRNSGKKGLFISIHANAFLTVWNNARGWEAFTTKGQNNSDKLADFMYTRAKLFLQEFNIPIRKDSSDGDADKEENFTVIYKSAYPAVLVENGFYTNKEDLNFMQSNEGKFALCNIILFGILDYAEKIYKI